MLGELSVNEFLTAVRTQSLPGGGTVAALAGALAASLLGKVCQLTIGREEFSEYEKQTKDIQIQCNRLGHGVHVSDGIGRRVVHWRHGRLPDAQNK